ncbi:MAG: metallophosphatase family protein [Flavobacteriales bacterium]|nr:metallophosphatase family protein [Flavobacteriales bacterium]
MKQILLLSDTHAFIDKEAAAHYQNADEIWHAGDIGSQEVLDYLETFAPVKAVYGNIDGQDIRVRCPEDQIFFCEGKKIWIRHIGAYPPKFNTKIQMLLKQIQPDIFICGHSHILKVMYDNNFSVLHINPGAFGKSGFHQERTMLKFSIDQGKIENMQVISKPKNP